MKPKVFLCECDILIDKFKLPPIGPFYFSWTKGQKFIKSSKFQASGSAVPCKEKLSLNLKLYQKGNSFQEKKTRFSLWTSKDAELWWTQIDVSRWKQNHTKLNIDIKNKKIESGWVSVRCSQKRILELDEYVRPEKQIEESFYQHSEKELKNSKQREEPVDIRKKQLQDANLMIQKLKRDRISYLAKNQQLYKENKEIKIQAKKKICFLQEFYQKKIEICQSVFSEEVANLIDKFNEDEKQKNQILTLLIKQINTLEEKSKVGKEKMIEELKHSHNQFQKKNLYHEESLRESHIRVSELERELNKYKDQVDKIIQDYRIQKQELVKRLNIFEQKSKDYEQQIIRLRSLLAKESEENDLVKNQARSLEDVIKEKSTTIEQIYTKNEILSGDIHTLKNQKAKLNKEIQHLEFEIDQVKKIRLSLDQELKKQKLERDKQIRAHMKTQDERDYEHQLQVDNLHKQLQLKQSQIMNLNFELKEKNYETIMMSKNEEFFKINISTLEEQLRIFGEEKQKLFQNNFNLTIKHDEVTKLLEGSQNQRNSLQSQNESLKIDNEVFQNKVKMLQEDITLLNKQFFHEIHKKDQFLEEQIGDLQKIKDDYDHAWNKCIKQTEEQRKVFHEELQNEKENKRELQTKKEELQKVIEKKTGQIAHIENSVNLFGQILQKEEVSPEEIVRLIFFGTGQKHQDSVAPINFLQTFIGPAPSKKKQKGMIQNIFSMTPKKEENQNFEIEPQKEEKKNKIVDKKENSIFGFFPLPIKKEKKQEKKDIKQQVVAQKKDKVKKDTKVGKDQIIEAKSQVVHQTEETSTIKKSQQNQSVLQKLKSQMVQSMMKAEKFKKQNQDLLNKLQKQKKQSQQLNKVIDRYGAQIDQLDKLVLQFKKQTEEAGKKIKDLKKKFQNKLQKEEQSEFKELEKIFGKASQLCETIEINFETENSDLMEEKELIDAIKINEPIKQNEKFEKEKKQNDVEKNKNKGKQENKQQKKVKRKFSRSRFRKQKFDVQIQVFIEDPKLLFMKQEANRLKKALSEKEKSILPQKQAIGLKQEQKKVKLKIFQFEKEIAIFKSQLQDKIQYIKKIQKQNEWLTQNLIKSRQQIVDEKWNLKNERKKTTAENDNFQKSIFELSRKNQELISQNLRLEHENQKLKIEIKNQPNKVEFQKIKKNSDLMNKMIKSELEKVSSEMNEINKQKLKLEKQKSLLEQKYEIVQKSKLELEKKLFISQSKINEVENEIVLEKRKRKESQSQQEEKDYQLQKYRKMQIEAQTLDPFINIQIQKLKTDKSKLFSENLDKQEKINKQERKIDKLQKTIAEYKNREYALQQSENQKKNKIFKDVMKLESKRRQSTNIIESLNEQNKNLRQKLILIQKQIEKQNQTESQTEQNACQEYENKLGIYREKILRLQAYLKNKMTVNQNLSEENKKLKEQVRKQKQINSRLGIKERKCNGEEIYQMKTNSHFQQNLRKLKRKIHEIEEERKMLLAEIEKSNNKIGIIKEKLEIQQKNNGLQNHKINQQLLKENSNTLNSSKNKQKNESLLFSENLNLQLKQRQKFESQIEKLKHFKSSKMQINQKIFQQINSILSSIESSKKKQQESLLSIKQAEIERIEFQQKYYEGQIDHLKQKNEQLNKKNKSLIFEKDSMKSQFKALKSLYIEVKTEKLKIERQSSQYKENLQLELAEKANLMIKIQKLGIKEKRYDNLNRENFELNQNCKNYSRQLSELGIKFTTIQSKMQQKFENLKIDLMRSFSQYAPRIKEKIEKILADHLNDF